MHSARRRRLTILKVEGYPSKLLKIKDEQKIPMEVSKDAVEKTKNITVRSDYLIGNKWLGFAR